MSTPFHIDAESAKKLDAREVKKAVDCVCVLYEKMALAAGSLLDSVSARTMEWLKKAATEQLRSWDGHSATPMLAPVHFLLAAIDEEVQRLRTIGEKGIFCSLTASWAAFLTHLYCDTRK